MPTIVLFNGSKWLGEDPDSVDTLLELLGREPLEPVHEIYGDFVQNASESFAAHHGTAPRGSVIFSGNFRNVSHAFSILTDDGLLCGRLSSAIRENTRREDYRMLLAQTRAEQAQKAARIAAAARSPR